jgi:hypothetical protein
MPSALYLFCLARVGLVPPLEGNGINGEEVLEMKDFSDIAAVVCKVPKEQFTSSAAEAGLKDLEWLGPRIFRHEQVIEQVMRYSPVLPARFGSLFSSAESLGSLVQSNVAEINQFLDGVARREEWSVKASLSRNRALDAILREKLHDSSEDLSALSPGIRYVKARQLRMEAEKELAGWTRSACDRVAKELMELSEKSRQRKILNLAKEDTDKQTVVNWAFLIDSSLVSDFLIKIEDANARFNAQGLSFEYSGPWPPYSFCPTLQAELEA